MQQPTENTRAESKAEQGEFESLFLQLPKEFYQELQLLVQEQENLVSSLEKLESQEGYAVFEKLIIDYAPQLFGKIMSDLYIEYSSLQRNNKSEFEKKISKITKSSDLLEDEYETEDILKLLMNFLVYPVGENIKYGRNAVLYNKIEKEPERSLKQAIVDKDDASVFCIAENKESPEAFFKAMDVPFLERLITYPWYIFSNVEDRSYLRGTNLFECPCPITNHHNRTFPGNTRIKMENILVNHIHKNNRDSADILSLGAGGFLQEVMLLIRAKIEAGIYGQIDLVLVEPDIDSEAYECLMYFLKYFQEIFDGSIIVNVSIFKSIDAVLYQNCKFDIIYAMDYEDYKWGKDYSSRKLLEREGKFDSKQYRATIDLIKATNLLKSDQTSLAIMSRGADIYSLTPAVQLSELSELTPISCIRGYDANQFNLFYLSTDIANLIFNLADIIAANKTLLVNECIIKDTDRESVKHFLERCNIKYQIVNEKEAIEVCEKNEGMVLVLDYTSFDSEKNESPVDINLPRCNTYFVRSEWTSGKAKETLIYDGLHTSIQELQTSNEPEVSTLLNKSIPRTSASLFKPKQVSLREYLQGLAQGDRGSRRKCHELLTALESKKLDEVNKELGL